jgi:hypothetical protein
MFYSIGVQCLRNKDEIRVLEGAGVPCAQQCICKVSKGGRQLAARGAHAARKTIYQTHAYEAITQSICSAVPSRLVRIGWVLSETKTAVSRIPFE